MNYTERLENDRRGLTYGIYFRNSYNEAVCIALFNSHSRRDEILKTMQIGTMYFAGNAGDTL